MKKNILILLMLSITLTISAKPGKIKYGKFLIYEGEVVDKQPSGAGTLKAIEPKKQKRIRFYDRGRIQWFCCYQSTHQVPEWYARNECGRSCCGENEGRERKGGVTRCISEKKKSVLSRRTGKHSRIQNRVC